jgi:hypothetical protein
MEVTINALFREPCAVKAAYPVLTGGLGRRTVRQRALILPTWNLAFLDRVKPALRLVTYDEAMRAQAEAVFRQRGRDHQLSWCDTISFVVVTRLLDDMACFSFDRDFKQLGLTVLS